MAATLIDPTPTGLVWLRNANVGGLTGAGIFVAVVGGLYAQFRGYDRLKGSLWRPIRIHIQDRLLALYRAQKPLTSEQEAYLRADRRLLDDNLFYNLVDNDASLKSRQTSVYANGLWVTSLLDFSIVSLAGWLFHVVFAFIRQSAAHTMWATACLTLSTASYAMFLPWTLKRHEQLSDLQLDYIDSYYAAEVVSRIDQSLSKM